MCNAVHTRCSENSRNSHRVRYLDIIGEKGRPGQQPEQSRAEDSKRARISRYLTATATRRCRPMAMVVLVKSTGTCRRWRRLTWCPTTTTTKERLGDVENARNLSVTTAKLEPCWQQHRLAGRPTTTTTTVTRLGNVETPQELADQQHCSQFTK